MQPFIGILIVLACVIGLGCAYGWAQWARGAHFVSHTLWSAWLCWVIAALGSRAWRPIASRRAAAPLLDVTAPAR